MRKLATIQSISEIRPIAKADAIEVAKVLGWHVVVKKDEFKINDPCVFFEIDSILPDQPWSQFLKDSSGKIKKLKTIKLRGQVSQGLALPLNSIPELQGIALDIGDDVTKTLGVTKFEEDVYVPQNGQKAKYLYPAWMPNWLGKILSRFLWGKKLFFIPQKTWPDFIPKTDETRVQILQPLLDKFSGMDCLITEKLDGSSCTVYAKNGKVGVCSRNLELNDDGNNFWNTVKAMDFHNSILKWGKNIAFQGELIGPGIQGNKYNLSSHRIYWFSAWNIESQEYENIYDYFPASECCPFVQRGYIFNDVDAWIEKAKGNSFICKDTKREGIVIRPLDANGNFIVDDTHGMCKADRVSFKAINPDFLLKYGE